MSRRDPASPEPSPRPSQSAATIASNSAWMMLDAIVGLAGGVAASIAIARLLGPQKLGYYSYLLWALSAVAASAAFGIPAATRKYAAEFLGAGRIRAGLDLVDRAWRVQLAVAVVTGAAPLSAILFLVPLEHRLFAVLGALCIAPSILMEIPTAANSAAQRYGATVIPSVIAAAVNLGGIAASLVLEWGLPGLAASLLAAKAVDLTLRRSFFQRVRRHLSATSSGLKEIPADPSLAARMRRFCVHSAALQLLNLIVWDRSEVFFLERYCDMRQVAFYAMPFNITTQALVFVRAFSSTASVNLMTKMGNHRDVAKAQASTILRYVALLVLPLLLGLAALSGPIVLTLYGAAYGAAAPVLMLLSIFAIARAALVPLLFTAAAFESQSWAVKVTFGCALLNLALDFLLIPARGAMGAALANGIAQLAAVCGLWMCVTRHMRIELHPAPLARVAAAALGAVAPGAILTLVSPAWFALVAGFVSGVALYPPLLRLTRALGPGDRDRIGGLVQQLPVPFRGAAMRFACWVTPAET